jgi:hypothetical protein
MELTAIAGTGFGSEYGYVRIDLDSSFIIAFCPDTSKHKSNSIKKRMGNLLYFQLDE